MAHMKVSPLLLILLVVFIIFLVYFFMMPTKVNEGMIDGSQLVSQVYGDNGLTPILLTSSSNHTFYFDPVNHGVFYFNPSQPSNEMGYNYVIGTHNYTQQQNKENYDFGGGKVGGRFTQFVQQQQGYFDPSSKTPTSVKITQTVFTPGASYDPSPFVLFVNSNNDAIFAYYDNNTTSAIIIPNSTVIANPTSISAVIKQYPDFASFLKSNIDYENLLHLDANLDVATTMPASITLATASLGSTTTTPMPITAMPVSAVPIATMPATASLGSTTTTPIPITAMSVSAIPIATMPATATLGSTTTTGTGRQVGEAIDTLASDLKPLIAELVGDVQKFMKNDSIKQVSDTVKQAVYPNNTIYSNQTPVVWGAHPPMHPLNQQSSYWNNSIWGGTVATDRSQYGGLGGYPKDPNGVPLTEFVPPVCPMYPPYLYPPNGLITPTPTATSTSTPTPTSQGTFLQNVGTGLENVGTGTSNLLTSAGTGASNLLTDAGTGASNLLTDAGSGGVKIVSQTVNTAGNIVEKTIDAAGNVVDKTFDTAGNLISTTAGVLEDAGAGAVGLAKDAGAGAVGLITGDRATATTAPGGAIIGAPLPVPGQPGYYSGGYQMGLPESQYANVSNYFNAIPQVPSNFMPMTNSFSAFGK
jgi:hypothetical protein